MNRWLLVFLAAVIPVTLQAQEGKKRFAVLEFSGTKDLKVDELEALSDSARAGVRAVLPRGERYVLMTRESMLTVLRQMGVKDCQEGECEVDTLQNIGADYGLTGKVTRIEGTFLVTMKLFDARTGNLLETAKVRSEKKLELVDMVEKEAAGMAGKGLHLGAPAPVVTTVPEVGSQGPRIKRSGVSAAVGNLIVEVKPKDVTRLEVTDPQGKTTTTGWRFENAQAQVGRWRLLARGTGHEDLRKDIDVPPDETTVEKLELRALGGLKVTGTPGGAAVKVTGPNGFSDEGGLPWEAEGLPAGSYRVEVTREGYDAFSQETTVEPGNVSRVTVDLVKKASAARPAAARSGGDAEVAQPGSRLRWLRCPVGQPWNGSSCDGKATEMNWGAAKRACPSGYRLPTKDELMALLVEGKPCRDSPVCGSMFGHDRGWYWSASPYAVVSSFAWYVSFFTGYTGSNDISGDVRVRCVR
jgi:TolB-like protein